MKICPDCGLRYQDPKRSESAPFVCTACLDNAEPRPVDGWPIESRWISSSKGRGVFASHFIPRGATIERCWVMPLSPEESEQTKNLPTLNRYLFPWSEKRRAIISGEGLIYNFASKEVTKREPNAECVLRHGISAVEFRALRDIREGVEICWDYKKAVSRPR
jgi:SET domain-containing protein